MTSFTSQLRLSDLRSFCMKNIYNNVFHLNKLPGYKRSSPLLLSSLLRDRTGKNYTVCCNTYALSFIFARMINDDFSPRRTASVLDSCTLQSAILLQTAQSIQQLIWIHRVELTWSSPRAPRICVNLWNITHSATNERATKLRIADLRRVVALTTGMLRFKMTFSHIDYTRTQTLQLSFILQNKIRIQFPFHSHSVVDYEKYCQLTSQARLML